MPAGRENLSLKQELSIPQLRLCSVSKDKERIPHRRVPGKAQLLPAHPEQPRLAAPTPYPPQLHPEISWGWCALDQLTVTGSWARVFTGRGVYSEGEKLSCLTLGVPRPLEATYT